MDSARQLVIVACTDKVSVLAGDRDGVVLGALDTGAGVNNIEYIESTKLLYAAAGKAAQVTVARLNENGQPIRVATIRTAEGARNAVVDARGSVYVVDAKSARLLVISAQSSRLE